MNIIGSYKISESITKLLHTWEQLILKSHNLYQIDIHNDKSQLLSLHDFILIHPNSHYGIRKISMSFSSIIL